MVGLALLAVLGACTGSNGYGGSGGTTSSAGSSGSEATGPLQTRLVPGLGDVLVDSQGDPLYFAEQERSGTIKCTGACLKVWLPVTGSASVSALGSTNWKIATVHRADSVGNQVTLNGAPLYAFAFDGGSGQAKGEGVADSFSGTSFTWHAAVVTPADGGSGGATSGGATSGGGTSDGGGSGGGGYGGGNYSY